MTEAGVAAYPQMSARLSDYEVKLQSSKPAVTGHIFHTAGSFLSPSSSELQD